MKDMIVPPGTSSVSIAGVEYRPDAKRHVQIAENHVELAKELFGLTSADDDENAGPDENIDTIALMNRSELFAYIKAGGGVAVPPISMATLRGIAYDVKKAVDARATGEAAQPAQAAQAADATAKDETAADDAGKPAGDDGAAQ